MNLIDKLKSISSPKIEILQPGNAETIKEFWDTFIEPHLPKAEIVLQWHNLLMEYIDCPNAMFAIRGYNNAPKDKYDDLRRGFLTRTSKDYSFFYTDNFHAAYYLKMALDGYVPSVDELLVAYNNREFPSRFGRDTSNERALMAIPRGKDPRIQTAGYKIAHIINVGTDYIFNGEKVTLQKIIDTFFDGGKRDDWKLFRDENEKYYVRDFCVDELSREYIIAEFLRFVHPFNYFLTPKKNLAQTSVCKDISEYQPLIKYVQSRFSERYGSAYNEFLNLIKYKGIKTEDIFGSEVINLTYGMDIEQVSTKPAVSSEKSTVKVERKKVDNAVVKRTPYKDADILIEFLTNPKTSFRKLERDFLYIDSQARGGGFVAKGIVNSHGFTIKDKGQYSIGEAEKIISSRIFKEQR